MTKTKFLWAEKNIWAENGHKSTLNIELLEFGINYMYLFLSIDINK